MQRERETKRARKRRGEAKVQGRAKLVQFLQQQQADRKGLVRF